MSGIFIIEDHGDLSGIGRRTHDQIDNALDQLLNATGQGQGTAQYTFSFQLTPALIVNHEFNAGVITVPLPAGQSLANYRTLEGYMDGRFCPVGVAWQPSSAGDAVQVYLPTDPATRSHYLNAGVFYDICWTT